MRQRQERVLQPSEAVATAPQSKPKLSILLLVQNCSYPRDPRVRREAITLASQGNEVAVVAPRRPGEPWRETIAGICIYRFPAALGARGTVGYLVEYAYSTIAIALLTLWLLLTRGFDVVHAANPPDTLFLVGGFCKLLGKSFIYDQHDLCPELYAVRFQRPASFWRRILLWLEGCSYRLADQVIVTNSSQRSMAITRGRVAPESVTVVRNGPDLDHLPPAEVDASLRARSRNILAYAGIIGYQDGYDYLCRTLHHLRYGLGRHDFYCIVMGDGDARRELEKLVRELKLEDCVAVLGWISDPRQYWRYLNTADLCLSPEPSNDYNDRSTLVKIMEYMTVGKPIVAFDLPETRFSAADAAFYVQPNQIESFAAALAFLMDHPSYRERMGRAGRKRIERDLAWQYSAPALLQAYERLLGRACASPGTQPIAGVSTSRELEPERRMRSSKAGN